MFLLTKVIFLIKRELLILRDSVHGAVRRKGAANVMGRCLPCPMHFLVPGGGYFAMNYKGSLYVTTMDA